MRFISLPAPTQGLWVRAFCVCEGCIVLKLYFAALAFSNSETSWFIDIVMSGGMYLKQKLEVPDVFALEWTKGLSAYFNGTSDSEFVPKKRLQVNDFLYWIAEAMYLYTLR